MKLASLAHLLKPIAPVLAACTLITGCELAAEVDPASGFDFGLEGQLLTREAWSKIAEATGGITYESKGTDDMAELVSVAISASLPQDAKLDLVFCVDPTGSMQDDIDAVKVKLGAIIDGLAATNPDWQIGVVSHRDRGDEYLTRTEQTLTADKALAQAAVDGVVADGGGDYREHVYAGLDAALRENAWREGAERRILLIGDAPPHESYSDDERNFANVTALAKELSVEVHAIGTHCDTACQLLVAAIGGAE